MMRRIYAAPSKGLGAGRPTFGAPAPPLHLGLRLGSIAMSGSSKRFLLGDHKVCVLVGCESCQRKAYRMLEITCLASCEENVSGLHARTCCIRNGSNG